ncbi:hypothetical protein COS52_03065, partial [Candidatus Roizmanbacteria bacterium CG03_land_8_20_14_0_80_39_12]
MSGLSLNRFQDILEYTDSTGLCKGIPARYRISVIREGIGKDNQKNLHSDFDFLVVAPKKPGGYSMITSYEQIVRSLNNDSY